MPKLLLNLRNVPDDEADEVRALLDAKRIASYETTPNSWGISAGGIWLKDDADFPNAKRAFDEYEQQRSVRVRAEYAAAKRAGTAETFVSLFRSDPRHVVLTLLGILFALGLMALPVILLRGWRKPGSGSSFAQVGGALVVFFGQPGFKLRPI